MGRNLKEFIYELPWKILDKLSGKIEPYEQFTGTVLKRYDGWGVTYYTVDVSGKEMEIEVRRDDLRINPGTSVRFYGRRKFPGEKELENRVEAFYLELVDSEGKVIAGYSGVPDL